MGRIGGAPPGGLGKGAPPRILVTSTTTAKALLLSGSGRKEAAHGPDLLPAGRAAHSTQRHGGAHTQGGMAAVLVLALAGVACATEEPPGGRDPAGSTTPTTSRPVELDQECSAPGDGYRIRFPSTWYALTTADGPPCRFFNAEPFTVPAAAEATGVAVTVQLVSLPLLELDPGQRDSPHPMSSTAARLSSRTGKPFVSRPSPRAGRCCPEAPTPSTGASTFRAGLWSRARTIRRGTVRSPPTPRFSMPWWHPRAPSPGPHARPPAWRRPPSGRNFPRRLRKRGRRSRRWRPAATTRAWPGSRKRGNLHLQLRRQRATGGVLA